MAGIVIRPGTDPELAATPWRDAGMLVAEADGKPAGHAVVRCVAREPDEWELLALEVAPEHRRRGVGEALLRKALREWPGTWFLEVRASNEAAIRLYAKLGFQEAGRRRDYYPSWSGTDREEGIVFTLRTC